MKIVLFEDSGYRNLLPLTYFRPVWELRCGIFEMWEKVRRLFPEAELFFSARQYLMDYHLSPSSLFVHGSDDEYLFINGRLLIREGDSEQLLRLPENTVYVSGDSIIAWRSKGQSSENYFKNGLVRDELLFNHFTRQDLPFKLIQYPWDLIDANSEEIVRDCQILGVSPNMKDRNDPAVHVLGADNVFLADSVRIMPGVVIDAESGPIWIGENVQIMPQVFLQGPLAICADSVIKVGAKIYGNSTIGPVCKVGGEVEETVIHSYSNKQHEGFLGHSYLGSWINLGADTNNSDLKNNYGRISVLLLGQKIDTGRRFLGAIIGDHSKTAINTMINTGSIIGTCSNIFGEGFPPKNVPSFSWGGSAGFEDYDFKKAVEVARIVMERRNITFTDEHFKLFQAVKDLSTQFE